MFGNEGDGGVIVTRVQLYPPQEDDEDQVLAHGWAMICNQLCIRVVLIMVDGKVIVTLPYRRSRDGRYIPNALSGTSEVNRKIDRAVREAYRDLLVPIPAQSNGRS